MAARKPRSAARGVPHLQAGDYDAHRKAERELAAFEQQHHGVDDLTVQMARGSLWINAMRTLPRTRPEVAAAAPLRSVRKSTATARAITDPVTVSLERLRGQMEAILEKEGLPPEAWHDCKVNVSVLLIAPDRDPTDIVQLQLRKPLEWSDKRKADYIDSDGLRAFLAHPERLTGLGAVRSWRVHWAAATAAAADAALATTDGDQRLVLGYAIERFQTLLYLPQTDSAFLSFKAVHRQKRAEKQKETNYKKRDVKIRRRYPELVQQNLVALMSEKDAKAQAVKTLARENGVEPQRIRDILNEE